MKSSISFCLVVICTVVLAAQQSQAKKGCNAYGHACYGGHGKRSLGTFAGGAGSAVGSEAAEMRPDGILQVLPNEAAFSADGDFDAYPRYLLIKIIKSLLGVQSRRPVERLSEFDYVPYSGESYNRLDSNSN